jgi:hypothetical protein
MGSALEIDDVLEQRFKIPGLLNQEDGQRVSAEHMTVRTLDGILCRRW